MKNAMKIVPVFRQDAWTRVSLISAFLLATLLLAACNSSTTPGPYATQGGKGCTKVGILLPETISSPRWETEDRPLLIQAIKNAIPGVHIDYNNAQNNSNLQEQQAETDLANGDCILIVGAHDSVAAATIVQKARAQNVPVIAYDRMIESDSLNYYVSFNNIEVGELQADYIVSHYQNYAQNGSTSVNMMMISGSQTDNNALLFSEGAHQVLDPYLAGLKMTDGIRLQSLPEIFTPNWDNNIAQSEAAAILDNNSIQIAYVANDSMAAGVIAALTAVHLNGKVLVTGQDGTAQGINNILLGYQSMTVYKPISLEAQATGKLVKAIYDGSSTASLINGKTATYDGGLIPSVLETPVLVDSSNILSEIINTGYLTRSQVCMNVPHGTDGVC